MQQGPLFERIMGIELACPFSWNRPVILKSLQHLENGVLSMLKQGGNQDIYIQFICRKYAFWVNDVQLGWKAVHVR